MTRFAAPALFLFAYIAAPLQAPQSATPAGQVYQLKPSPKTVVWGYYDPKTPPVLRIKSGDTAEIQTLVACNPERFESAGLGPDQIEQPLRDTLREVRETGAGSHILTGRLLTTAARPGGETHVRAS